jgi:hypothetical protein
LIYKINFFRVFWYLRSRYFAGKLLLTLWKFVNIFASFYRGSHSCLNWISDVHRIRKWKFVSHKCQLILLLKIRIEIPWDFYVWVYLLLNTFFNWALTFFILKIRFINGIMINNCFYLLNYFLFLLLDYRRRLLFLSFNLRLFQFRACLLGGRCILLSILFACFKLAIIKWRLLNHHHLV